MICELIGEPIKQSATSIGEPIKGRVKTGTSHSTGARAEAHQMSASVFLCASRWPRFGSPPHGALRVSEGGAGGAATGTGGGPGRLGQHLPQQAQRLLVHSRPHGGEPSAAELEFQRRGRPRELEAQRIVWVRKPQVPGVLGSPRVASCLGMMLTVGCLLYSVHREPLDKCKFNVSLLGSVKSMRSAR